MTETNDSNGKRTMNPNSLKNLELGAKARYQGKVKATLTLLPTTLSWLKGKGNASRLIDEMVEAARAGQFKPADRDSSQSGELEKLRRELKELRQELERLRLESSNTYQENLNLKTAIVQLQEKTQNRERGYRSNGAGQLIKELQSLDCQL